MDRASGLWCVISSVDDRVVLRVLQPVGREADYCGVHFRRLDLVEEMTQATRGFLTVNS